MLLLTLLLHLLVAHLLTARDGSVPDVPVTLAVKKDTQYLVKHVESCPAVGYFFKRETVPNFIEPGPCYLCFCQEDNTAICWKRDNRRCDVESFHYHGVGKRDTRIRRSPGFADLFFRDATRDLFNKNGKTECKPFESSFSDDCPPADWCTGCTVCDCDANGRWDCHVLSFCADEKGKKKSKHKVPGRKVVAKKPVRRSHTSKDAKPSSSAKTSKSSQKSKSTKKSPPKTTNKAKPQSKTTPSMNSKTPSPKRVVKKSLPVKSGITQKPRQRTPVRFKRINKSNTTKKTYIKKNIATHNPIDIHTSKVNFEMEIAQKVMKTVMSNIRKSMQDEVFNLTKMATDVANNKGPFRRNIKPMKPGGKGKAKSNPPKKVNKRQIKKPQRRPPSKKANKKPVKKAPRRYSWPPKKYVRNKRDLIMAGDFTTSMSITEGYNTVDDYTSSNPTVVISETDSTANNSTKEMSIIPMSTNLVISDVKNYTPSVANRSTLPDNRYYRYSISAELPEKPPEGEEIERYPENKESINTNTTETIINLMATNIPPSISVKKYGKPIEVNKIISITSGEINPEANDLKYSKWTNLKVLKEKKIMSSEKHKSIIKLISPANITLIEKHKKILHGKDVEKSPWKRINRKHTLVKLINYKQKINNNKIDKASTEKIPEKNLSNIAKTSTKLGDLQSILGKLLKDFGNDRTSNNKSSIKTKKFSIIKYLRKIFNKMFKRKKTSRFSKHQIIESLCEAFGPCKVSIKDKKVLRAKLMALDSETIKIMKRVKVIKGLLTLIDIPMMGYKGSKKKTTNNDILKLNTILKDSYAVHTNLTDTQKTQIEYIKKNTQDFIESVSRFASLLNEIIAILTKPEKNIIKSNRMLRNTDINKDITADDPFEGLKSLLVKYNLIQNSFLKQMYDQLNNFEYKMTENPKVSEVPDLSNSVAIENFSRNIIQNLRKLKGLAQTLSSSRRSKREVVTRDDDAVEYLLMLMEYLLKQNHPLDAAPVNDGIDLLIEAIKNAPDIKPIKKKVLEYTHAPMLDTTTIPSITTPGTGDSDDDSPSDSDRSSIEYMGKVKIEDNDDKKLEENRELAELVVEEDKDSEDKYQYDRKVDKMEDITEAAYYSRGEYNAIAETESALEITTPGTLEIEIINNNKGDKGDRDEAADTAEKPIVEENNNLERRGGGNMDEKKFEIFTGDMDEEILVPGTFTVSEVPYDATTDLTTQSKKSKTKMRHLNLESFDSESIDKKSKLEWIEENFGRENEKEFAEMDDNNSNITINIAPKTTTSPTTNRVDMSVLTREIGDETDKKRKAKINAEEVMLRKQMDLLNSLDYGTEKTEAEESESKDGNNGEDRYSGDTFSSYFV